MIPKQLEKSVDDTLLIGRSVNERAGLACPYVLVDDLPPCSALLYHKSLAPGVIQGRNKARPKSHLFCLDEWIMEAAVKIPRDGKCGEVIKKTVCTESSSMVDREPMDSEGVGNSSYKNREYGTRIFAAYQQVTMHSLKTVKDVRKLKWQYRLQKMRANRLPKVARKAEMGSFIRPGSAPSAVQ